MCGVGRRFGAEGAPQSASSRVQSSGGKWTRDSRVVRASGPTTVAAAPGSAGAAGSRRQGQGQGGRGGTNKVDFDGARCRWPLPFSARQFLVRNRYADRISGAGAARRVFTRRALSAAPARGPAAPLWLLAPPHTPRLSRAARPPPSGVLPGSPSPCPLPPTSDRRRPSSPRSDGRQGRAGASAPAAFGLLRRAARGLVGRSWVRCLGARAGPRAATEPLTREPTWSS